MGTKSTANVHPGALAVEVTLAEHLESILPGSASAESPPSWPPDCFAVVASALERADAYGQVVNRWPPGHSSAEAWSGKIEDLGKRWRKHCNADGSFPKPLTRLWESALRFAGRPLRDLRKQTAFWESFVELCSIADAASDGVGIPPLTDEFDYRALMHLSRSGRPSSCCERVAPSRMIVLPKLHTPQGGMTLRSLTHHLGLHWPGEVSPSWRLLPWQTITGKHLNILVLPWPKTVSPSHFRQIKGSLRNLPEGMGFFACSPRAWQGKPPIARLRKLLLAAERQVGKVQMLVFPEGVLRASDVEVMCRELQVTVVGGVQEPPGQDGWCSNSAAVATPIGPIPVMEQQPKHHRWRIDAAQIEAYGIGSSLSPERTWWEGIAIPERRLTFWNPAAWCSFCVLICEDLARQDPVADLVRAVGPNLVIALLLDGPQLESRWSARCATVLADDPGSSVLTLTCLGMAKLSRVAGKPVSTAVALWKDGLSKRTQELSLDSGSEGLVLTLSARSREEWTADGRSDGRRTWYLSLAGVHQVAEE